MLMRKQLSIFCVLVFGFEITAGLKCWNCVGPDCDGPMRRSEFAEEQICEQGAMCQKTYTIVLDVINNVTLRSEAVRSCSYRIGCEENFNTEECEKDGERMANLGCHRRYCCSTDFCNKAASVSAIGGLLFFSVLLLGSSE